MPERNPYLDELADRAAELALRDVLIIGRGNEDHELVDRLQRLSDTMMPVELALSPQQTAALTRFFRERASCLDDLDNEETRAFLAGVRYGFGLGHCFVARYGALVESPEVGEEF